MWPRYVALKPIHWGVDSQAVRGLVSRSAAVQLVCGIACLVAALRIAAADPVPAPAAADSPPGPVVPLPVRHAPSAAASGPASGPGPFGSTEDLDGAYLWLGPLGAASHIDGQWDSTLGAEAALVVVRERAPLAVLGADLGASRWTVRGGGRVWLDGLVGTQIAGRLAGISLGPILELSALAHTRAGGALGAWAFVGVTPFVRIGAVADLGMFAEFGIHIALPVLRR